MRDGWKRVKLGEVCSLITKGTTPHVWYSGEGGVSFFKAENIVNGFLRSENLKYISREVHESELKRSQLVSGDLLITIAGAIGRVALVRDMDLPANINQAVAIARPETQGVCARYIYYQLRQPLVTQWLVALAAGQSVQANLNLKQVSNIELSLPPLPTQQRIAAVLGALDDKIELNRKMNANLEAQAQALFKSWFIDFEPWGGQMPAGWKKGSLLDIAEYTNGLPMQKFRPVDDDEGLPVLKIKELRQGCVDDESERCRSDLPGQSIVKDGDVVFSWSGTLLVDFWCGGRVGLNQHLFKVTSDIYEKWYYYLWTKHHNERFAAIASAFATTMGHIKRGELERAKVVIPDDMAMVDMSRLMEPICELVIKNRCESRQLAALRDALLPKLMSGELSVEEVA